MSSEQDEIARLQAARQAHREDVGLASAAGDKETYGTGTPRSAYVDSLPAGSPADDDAPARTRANPLDAFSAPQHLLDEFADDSFDPLADLSLIHI